MQPNNYPSLLNRSPRAIVREKQGPLKFDEQSRIAADFLRGKGHQVAAGGGVCVWRFDDIEVSDLGLIALALDYQTEWLAFLAQRKAIRAA